MSTPEKLDESTNEYLAAVISGLSAEQKTIPFVYVYDEQGSEFFDRVCDQPEYYATRTEKQILRDNAGSIAEVIGPRATLIELGAGTVCKIGLLLSRLERSHAYIPVDIAPDLLMAGAADVAGEFPDLKVAPLCADFTKEFSLPVADAPPGGGIKVGVFFGTTIGNFFELESAVSFLANFRKILGPGGLMIVGVDLVKDDDILYAAYNDAAGATAAFAFNILHRVNRELGGTFDVANFSYEGRWVRSRHRIEMHLDSLVEQTAQVDGSRFRFRAGESIHIANCHKFTVESFGKLATAAGYVPEACWIDERKLYSLHALRVSRD